MVSCLLIIYGTVRQLISVFLLSNIVIVTGVPAYDELYQKWQAQPVPANL